MIAIAITSFKEALRKKMILLIGVLTVLYIILLTVITAFAMDNLRKTNVNEAIILNNASVLISFLGFYFSSMIVSFLSIMASVGGISSEIESGAIHAILTKPISRAHYVLGKYLGVGILITVYSTILYMAIVMINFFVGVPPLDKLNFLLLIKGELLFILEPLAVLALCIFGGVLFKTINNGIVVIAIYIFGAIGGMMEQIGTVLKVRSLADWGIVISLISPFDVVYRKLIETIYASSSVSILFSSPLFISNNSPSLFMMLYVCVYIVGLIWFSTYVFGKKDIS